jgi:hypothetical protein
VMYKMQKLLGKSGVRGGGGLVMFHCRFLVIYKWSEEQNKNPEGG